jgi:hypothetical protein
MNRWIVPIVFTLAACTAKENQPAADSAGSTTAQTGNADPDRNPGGGGLPAGFTARTYRPDAKTTDAKYVADGNTWDVTTGPAHIIYAAKDLGSGDYTVSTTFEQLEKPTHPEAYGIIFGGHDLDGANQTYSYFLVRGTGDLAVKVREGSATRDVIKWTPSADVPRQDGAGKARYDLAVQVTADAVKFMVNGKQAASVSKAALPVDGIAGLRINHNLHVKANPVTITHP